MTVNTPDYNIYSTIKPPILQQQILEGKCSGASVTQLSTDLLYQLSPTDHPPVPLRFFANPPYPSRTITHSPGAAHDILGLLGSKHQQAPIALGRGQPPASTSTSGIGNGAFIFATTLWWCGAEGSVATFGLRRTEL